MLTCLLAGLVAMQVASAQAAVIDPFDVIPGGGSGWQADWAILANNGGNFSASLGTAGTELLSGSGTYAALSNTNTGQGTYNRDPVTTVTASDHKISFLMRVDAYDDMSTGDLSRAFQAFGGGAVAGTSSTATWALFLEDDTFHYFNGNGDGTYAGAVVDSGVAFNGTGSTSSTTHDIGDVFEVVVVNRIGAQTSGSPLTLGEYDLIVDNLTDNTNVLTLTGLDYRIATGTAGTFINIGIHGNHMIGIDNVGVTTVPEPLPLATLSLLGLAFCHWRAGRRSRPSTALASLT